MNDLLIRTERRWLPRAIDFLLTLLAWLGFLYLFIHGFIAVLQHNPSARMHLHFGLLFATIDTLATYLLVGLVNALILLTWAKYNEIRRRVERRKPIPALTQVQLLASFGLTLPMLQTLRDNRICTVHHNDAGRVVAVSAGSVCAPHAEQSLAEPPAQAFLDPDDAHLHTPASTRVAA